jgi:lipopolysaccharide/colanic/teichoic acid biosynthesis glycosyltransferase
MTAVAPPRSGTARRAGLVAKATLDRVGAVILLVVLSPVLVAAAVAVTGTSRGGVLFRQERTGRHGQRFTILKLRTMVADAEGLRGAVSTANRGDGHLFKVHADPRVTRVGRILRRTSIDELPQLWNVVRGDMSLVGPRPLPVPAHAFSALEARRHDVRPGLTGLWQVSGRSDLSWREAVRLDLHYVENWTLALDIRILVRTPAAVLRSTGAY